MTAVTYIQTRCMSIPHRMRKHTRHSPRFLASEQSDCLYYIRRRNYWDRSTRNNLITFMSKKFQNENILITKKAAKCSVITERNQMIYQIKCDVTKHSLLDSLYLESLVDFGNNMGL